MYTHSYSRLWRKPLKWLRVNVGTPVPNLKVGENETRTACGRWVESFTAFGFSLFCAQWSIYCSSFAFSRMSSGRARTQ
jgi:hypothetical protein